MPAVGIGLHTVPRGTGDPATEPYPSHTMMLDDAVFAEQVGFDSIWVPDHFYFERPWGLETYPEAWTLLTAIAMRTERALLGHNVLAAGFRHPALLAKMAGALQELSGGRLILGMGAGNQIHEHTAFDLGFERRIGRFKEYMAILAALMAGETVSMEGRHYTLREATLRTAVPKVPIWIASGAPQMFDLTARYASGWNAAGAGRDPETFAGKYAGFATACAAAGRDVKELDVGLIFFTAVAPDEATAAQIVEELSEKQKTPPDALAQRMTIGTPDQIAAKMRGFVGVGVNHFLCAISEVSQLGYQDSIELFAREVFPRVRA